MINTLNDLKQFENKCLKLTEPSPPPPSGNPKIRECPN